MQMLNPMKVARMHDVGGPLKLEDMERPEPREKDVLVRVKACGIVPNLGNILSHWTTWFPDLPLPPLPAIFGLDPAGEVVGLGSSVRGVEIGQRVYVNPGRSCGTCRHCTRGDTIACQWYTFNGYFGFSNKSEEIFREYPYAGLGEYMTAPATSLVKLPDSVTYEQGARFGYIGTAYSALRKAGLEASSTVLINGASGTLGLGGVISALAMGARKILGTGRDKALLKQLEALAPGRIETFAIGDGSISKWAKDLTGGEGVDIVVDCLGPGALHETFLDGLYSLRRGGTIVNVGAVAGDVPINVHYMMDRNMRLIASVWFTTAEGQELAAFAESGLLNLSVFEHHTYPLSDVNSAISGIAARNGGFSNFVVHP